VRRYHFTSPLCELHRRRHVHGEMTSPSVDDTCGLAYGGILGRVAKFDERARSSSRGKKRPPQTGNLRRPISDLPIGIR
jgi:hypothetical protein